MDSLLTLRFTNTDKQRIYNLIGYSDATEVSARVKRLMDSYTDNSEYLINISQSYTFRDVETVNGSRVVFNDSTVLESSVVANLCKRCDKVAVFVTTIGTNLEEMVSCLNENNLVLQGTVLDAIGSIAAEHSAELAEDNIKHMVEIQGLCISRRFSPGYCDWAVNQQQQLFGILGDDTAEVSITDQYLMLPRKSVSGLIGIGEAGRGIEEYNPCRKCKKQTCPGRRN